MSLLLEIRKQLSSASERVLSLERALREHPDVPSIAANLDSAVRIKEKLEAEFADVAEKLGHDICTYRAFDEFDKPNAAAAFAAIADFQRLISVVYGAMKYGEKKRATVSDRVQKETAFDLGYTFAGSVGVVLTVRNDRPLLEQSDLDAAFELIAAMAKASSSDDIMALASKLGPGPINALYRWADEQASAGLGADIEWRKGQQVHHSLLVQRQEMSRLRTTIEETSGEEIVTESVVGILKMADVDKHKFKLKREGLSIIGGTLEPGCIDDEHVASLPKKYLVDLQKTVRFQFAKGTEVVRYHILRLREPTAKQRKHA